MTKSNEINVHPAITLDSTSTIYIKHPQTSQYSVLKRHKSKCFYETRNMYIPIRNEYFALYSTIGNYKNQFIFVHKHVTKTILFSAFTLTVIEVLLEIEYNKNISDKLREIANIPSDTVA